MKIKFIKSILFLTIPILSYGAIYNNDWLIKMDEAIAKKDISLLNSFLHNQEHNSNFENFLQFRILQICESFPESVLTLLQYGKETGMHLIKDRSTLLKIIESCDEETIKFTIIATYPNSISELLFPGDLDKIFSTFSNDLQTILINNGYAMSLQTILNSPKGVEWLDQVLKINPGLIINQNHFDEFFYKSIINSRFDIFEVLAKNIDFEITKNIEIEIEEIILAAVKSTETGSRNMFNHILDAFNLHGNPLVLAFATTANSNNSTGNTTLCGNSLFNDLLNEGYRANPDPINLSNLIGLAYAIISNHEQAAHYYLKLGVDPNAVIQVKDYELPENYEMIDLLIEHGLKIINVHLAACAQQGRLHLIKYFKEKGYDINHPGIFVAACKSGNLELIKFLIKEGANIDNPSALAATASSYKIEILNYLLEKGANPNNLIAMNEALKESNPQLPTANFLLKKGAKIDYRNLVNAGLTGHHYALKWAMQQMNMPITDEIQEIFNRNSESDIIKYTLTHILPKNAILIGIINSDYHFADGITNVCYNIMMQDSNFFVVPLTQDLAEDDSIMKKFSGIISPGAGDSYPKLPLFSLKDIDENKMTSYEQLYKKISDLVKEYDIPYLGICLGSQYLTLSSEGYLQPTSGHAGTIAVHFEKGTIPHYMTLLPHEKAKALRNCQLEDIIIHSAVVAHEFSAVKDRLGNNIKLGAISGKNNSIVEMIAHGHNQIGVQFHPERGYLIESENEINRQKILLDNFFQNAINHQCSCTYGLEHGIEYSDIKNNIQASNEKLIQHLETCANNPAYVSNEYFLGKNLGSDEIQVTDKKDKINVLTGLTANDIGLAREDDDLIIIIKSTDEILRIHSHFDKHGDHRVKSINFADGSKWILNTEELIQDKFCVPLEN